MSIQDLRETVKYLTKIRNNALMLGCPQHICDTIDYLNELIKKYERSIN